MISKEVEKLLLKVQKPGRYVGGELNQVIKNSKLHQHLIVVWNLYRFKKTVLMERLKLIGNELKTR